MPPLYLIAIGGSLASGRRAQWYVTIRPNEHVDDALVRMKAARGVLWKWDQIDQLSCRDRADGVCLDSEGTR